MMDIRQFNEQEIQIALQLARDVFMQDVAPGYPPEGVDEFQRFTEYENILGLIRSGEMYMFGALRDGGICGMIAVKGNGHISLFFVRKEFQGKGIGKMLFQTVYNFCAAQLRVNRLTVNASPGAVPIYQKLGMRQSKEEQAVNGIRFIPMEAMVVSGLVSPVEKNSDKKLVIGLSVGGVALLVALLILGLFLVQRAYHQVVDNPAVSEEDEWGNDADQGGNYDEEDPMNPDSGFGDSRGQDENGEADDGEGGGIQDLPEYIAEDLSYEIQEKTYTYDGENEKTTQVYFDVAYPQLSGLEGKVADQVNQRIQQCAMQSVSEIYEEPSEEFKEKILNEEAPMLMSYVQYKVCYANEGFISIAFSDDGFAGGQNDYFQHLRCLNINLEDGTVYEAKDILDIDDDFIRDWLQVMRSEASDDELLSELDETQMKDTLSGKDIDGNYIVQFFVDKDGIEVGYDFNFDADSGQTGAYAWVTAPFSFEETKKYRSDSSMWEMIDGK